MNMKKSIAGVMAGALAVSAMATTASAWTGGDADQGQIVLSYDLNLTEWVEATSSLSVTWVYADNTNTGYVVNGLTKAGTPNDTIAVKIGAKLGGGNYRLTAAKISGTSMDGKSTDTWGIYDNKEIAPAWASAVNNAYNPTKDLYTDANLYGYEVKFTTTTDTLNAICLAGFEIGGEVSVKDYSETYKLTDYETLAAAKTALGEKGTEAAIIAKIKAKNESVAGIDTVKGYYITGTTANEITIQGTDAAPTDVNTKGSTANDVAGATLKLTYGGVTSAANAEAKFTADYQAAYPNSTVAVTKTETENGQVKVTGSVTTVTAPTGYGFKNYSVTLAYDLYSNDWTNTNVAIPGLTPAFTNLAGDKLVIDAIDSTATGQWSYTAGAWLASTYPLRSNYNFPGNVIDRLTDNKYTYPQAVLNDVIANNENVSFTFTTSSKYVDTRDYVPATFAYTDQGGKDYYYITDAAGGNKVLVQEKAVVADGKTYVTNPFRGAAYDSKKLNTTSDQSNHWYNPYFTQDLYQSWTWAYLDGNDVHVAGANNGYNVWGPNTTQQAIDVFGSYASGWNKNLLAAGLVVNAAWTMQLNQATAFEWGDQTITFFWDDITADKNITNAANFVTSLQLYTPVEWFWEKLDVAVGAAISDDVASNAPLEEEPDPVEEEEVIEEEPADEDLDEDFDEDFDEDLDEDFDEDLDEDFDEDLDEDFDEDLDEEEEEPVEEEVVVEVESPKTGNAPIALAVIPVALAAAAVIAKKKN